MRPIKYRLLNEHRKIVGYEKWHKGNFNMETKKDYYVSEPLWLYSKDDKYWNPEIIRHRYKDQFTGLHDRNGKEIYESDILNKQYHNLSIIDGIGAVNMDVGADSDVYNHGEWWGWMCGDSSLLDIHRECEVIGNIHENPELLETK